LGGSVTAGAGAGVSSTTEAAAGSVGCGSAGLLSAFVAVVVSLAGAVLSAGVSGMGGASPTFGLRLTTGSGVLVVFLRDGGNRNLLLGVVFVLVVLEGVLLLLLDFGGSRN